MRKTTQNLKIRILYLSFLVKVELDDIQIFLHFSLALNNFSLSSPVMPCFFQLKMETIYIIFVFVFRSSISLSLSLSWQTNRTVTIRLDKPSSDILSISGTSSIPELWKKSTMVKIIIFELMSLRASAKHTNLRVCCQNSLSFVMIQKLSCDKV